MLIPKPVIEKVVDRGSEFVPILGPVVRYGRKAVQVTKFNAQTYCIVNFIEYIHEHILMKNKGDKCH